jgi:hypothetical protein
LLVLEGDTINYLDGIQLTWDTEYAASLKLYRNGDSLSISSGGTTLHGVRIGGIRRITPGGLE